MTSAPLRLRLDGAALADNWRTLAAMSGGAACGAAVKADGYGLGAVDVAKIWLDYMPPGRIFTAERVAVRNLLEAYLPPETATRSG